MTQATTSTISGILATMQGIGQLIRTSRRHHCDHDTGVLALTGGYLLWCDVGVSASLDAISTRCACDRGRMMELWYCLVAGERQIDLSLIVNGATVLTIEPTITTTWTHTMIPRYDLAKGDAIAVRFDNAVALDRLSVRSVWQF